MLCVHSEVFSLEPKGNDFTSSGHLGFLLTQTMSGCRASNREGRGNERKREKETGGREKGPILDPRKSLTREPNSTNDHTPQ